MSDQFLIESVELVEPINLIQFIKQFIKLWYWECKFIFN